MVLEIRPRPRTIAVPRLYGIPGEIAKAADGYVLRTSGPQGTTERFAVLLPEGSEPIATVEAEKKIPDLDRRQWNWDPTALKLLASGRQGGADGTDVPQKGPVDRSAAVVRPLRQPRRRPEGQLAGGTFPSHGGDVPVVFAGRFPLTAEKLKADGNGPLANFCGAYLENGFSEDQDTVIYLRTGAAASPAVPAATGLESLSNVAPPVLPAAASPLAKNTAGSWWLQTKFTTPLAQWGGAEGKLDDHTLIVLPFVDQNRVKRIAAWINGQPVDVQTYRYPRNRAMMCRWIDIVGTAIHPGVNDLVLQLEMD